MQNDWDQPVFTEAAVRVLRADEPSPAELASAHRKFHAKRAVRRPRQSLVGRWALVGWGMGLSAAFAAEAVVDRVQAPSVALPVVKARPQTSSAPNPRPAASTVPLASSLPPSASVASATSVASARMPPAIAPSVAPSSYAPLSDALKAEPSEPAAQRAAWSRAARGLRNDDEAEVLSALALLDRSQSAPDREAARLIRAQLLLHRGDTGGARLLLEELLNGAQSALVRDKARSLLKSTPAPAP